MSGRKGGAGFGLRKMVGIERTPLWEVCNVDTTRALRMREEKDVEDCASMVSTSSREFIEELWAAPRGFYNYLSRFSSGSSERFQRSFQIPFECEGFAYTSSEGICLSQCQDHGSHVTPMCRTVKQPHTTKNDHEPNYPKTSGYT